LLEINVSYLTDGARTAHITGPESTQSRVHVSHVVGIDWPRHAVTVRLLDVRDAAATRFAFVIISYPSVFP
jgi:hypothetical protein